MKRPSAETLEKALLEAVTALKWIDETDRYHTYDDGTAWALGNAARETLAKIEAITSGYIRPVEVSECRSVTAETLG